MNWSMTTAAGHYCSTCYYSMQANLETMDVADCYIEYLLDGEVMTAASAKLTKLINNSMMNVELRGDWKAKRNNKINSLLVLFPMLIKCCFGYCGARTLNSCVSDRPLRSVVGRPAMYCCSNGSHAIPSFRAPKRPAAISIHSWPTSIPTFVFPMMIAIAFPGVIRKNKNDC